MFKTSLTLNIELDDLELAEIAELRDALDEVLAGFGVSSPPAEEGWTPTRTAALLAALERSRGKDQAAVIRRAVELGGSVDRADVYELCSYAADRSLKGFTRPVNRVIKELKEDGVIPGTLPSPLKPIYDPAVAGYQQAKGFTVPGDFVAATSVA